MKMLNIIYTDYFEDLITKELRQAGFKKYTKVQGTTGVGEVSGAKLGTSYAPGKNNILYMLVSEDEVPTLFAIVQKLRRDHPKGGFRALTYTVDEFI